MECSEEVKQAGLERVVVYLCGVEARTLARWRGQVMWHSRYLCGLRKSGWDSKDWVPGLAEASALQRGEAKTPSSLFSLCKPPSRPPLVIGRIGLIADLHCATTGDSLVVPSFVCRLLWRYMAW